MREIKVRARDRIDKCWVYSSNNGLYDFFYGIEDGQLDGETLGEFTGLHDKNGKEIYEGDVVEAGWGYGCPKVVVDLESIYYAKGECCISDEIEVIGNIYENPELLGVRNEKSLE